MWREPPVVGPAPTRETRRERSTSTCTEGTQRVAAVLATPSPLFRGFRPRFSGTFCRSRRDLAIGVVGTTAFHARPVRNARTRIRDYVLGWRIPGALGAVGALDEGFRHRSKRTFCRSRRDLGIGVVGTTAFHASPVKNARTRIRRLLHGSHA